MPAAGWSPPMSSNVVGATGLPLKGVIAVVIGNWLEFYDFLVFTFFGVTIAYTYVWMRPVWAARPQ